MRLPVSLLIWLKLTFSRSLVAGKSWIGQDTSERRRKPFQYARGAMERSYTTNFTMEQDLRDRTLIYRLRASFALVPAPPFSLRSAKDKPPSRGGFENPAPAEELT